MGLILTYSTFLYSVSRTFGYLETIVYLRTVIWLLIPYVTKFLTRLNPFLWLAPKRPIDIQEPLLSSSTLLIALMVLLHQISVVRDLLYLSVIPTSSILKWDVGLALIQDLNCYPFGLCWYLQWQLVFLPFMFLDTHQSQLTGLITWMGFQHQIWNIGVTVFLRSMTPSFPQTFNMSIESTIRLLISYRRMHLIWCQAFSPSRNFQKDNLLGEVPCNSFKDIFLF